MTPQERAEAVVRDWTASIPTLYPSEEAALAKLIAQAIVASNNEETERRRDAEGLASRFQAAIRRAQMAEVVSATSTAFRCVQIAERVSASYSLEDGFPSHHAVGAETVAVTIRREFGLGEKEPL